MYGPLEERKSLELNSQAHFVELRLNTKHTDWNQLTVTQSSVQYDSNRF
jgi:hypothetical protein